MQIMLCAISNIASGNCSEDCKYCTQSAHVKTDIQKYRRKELSQIVLEAKMAKKNEALGFCLVTAGLGLDDEKLEYVCEAAKWQAWNNSKNLKKQEFFLIITILKVLRNFFHKFAPRILGKVDFKPI